MTLRCRFVAICVGPPCYMAIRYIMLRCAALGCVVLRWLVTNGCDDVFYCLTYLPNCLWSSAWMLVYLTVRLMWYIYFFVFWSRGLALVADSQPAYNVLPFHFVGDIFFDSVFFFCYWFYALKMAARKNVSFRLC